MIRSLMALAVGCFALVLPVTAMQAVDFASPTLRIPWTEFKKLLDEKKVLVIDVRSADAFEAGHIPGARLVPLDQVEARVAELKKLNRPIVVYCAWPAENTSARAALTLQKAGIDARALIGGYARWVNETGKIERGKT